MNDLRQAAQQAIALICSARLCEINSMSSRQEMLRLLIEATDLLRAALAQPSPEPVARECSDPMCACRGGPCAECEEGQREKEIEDLRCSLDFYQRRCEALQSWQSKMRDPERTIVCDILANGFTLDPAFAGNRYTAPPQRTPLTEEEIQDCFHVARNAKLGASQDNSKHRLSVVEIARAIEQAHGIKE